MGLEGGRRGGRGRDYRRKGGRSNSLVTPADESERMIAPLLELSLPTVARKDIETGVQITIFYYYKLTNMNLSLIVGNKNVKCLINMVPLGA